MDMSQTLSAARRIIIKVGSALVTDEEAGAVRADWLASVAADIAALMKDGKQVVVVTSGAIALGRAPLGIARTLAPSAIPLEQKQAAAALGQFTLFRAWHEALAGAGLGCAQILLSLPNTEDRRSHLNARATMQELLGRGIVPVINENDTVSTREIRFGDNDRLAARVGQMIEADAVVLLSTTDGLFTADPGIDPAARHIPVVESLSEDILAMAGDAPPGLTTGGMKAKLEAARLCTQAGVAMAIANGLGLNPVAALLGTPPARSTLFLPSESRAGARKRWIQGHVNPQGTLTVDDGAVTALRAGKSLLPIGVVAVDGEFRRGDAVRIVSKDGRTLGIGLSAYNAWDAGRIRGRRSEEIPAILGYTGRAEIIHRDDLAMGE